MRRPRVVWTEQTDWQIADAEPELSAMAVALSLLMPHLEPYLLRSMQQASPHIRSAALAADLRLFCAQEGQHHALHTRFNASLAIPCSERLVALLADVEADYRRFTNTRSLRFSLAYAEGFEAFTTAFALFCHDQGWLKKLRPGARELFEWHMLEELEHRRAAFDVYREVSDDYWVRVAVNLFAQWHLQRFTFRAAGALLAARPKSETQGVRARLRAVGRTLPHCWAAFRHLAPRALATLLPGWSPGFHLPPEEFRALKQTFAQPGVKGAALSYYRELFRPFSKPAREARRRLRAVSHTKFPTRPPPRRTNSRHSPNQPDVNARRPRPTPLRFSRLTRRRAAAHPTALLQPVDGLQRASNYPD